MPLPGKLLACPAAPWDGRVFWVYLNQRRWIPSVECLRSYGLALTDVVQAAAEEIDKYDHAAVMPMVWTEDAWRSPPRTDPQVLREVACSKLSGSGVEFGAGANPMSLPWHCEVSFADFLPADQIRSIFESQGPDFVRLSHVTTIECPAPIPENSLDFVIASHVIEHIRNPLRAIEQVYRRLKPGGRFVLVVPDKEKTFDNPRAVTSLDHLIADYERPDLERDVADYVDFWQTLHGNMDHDAFVAVKENRNCHYHVWTYDSFAATIQHCGRFAPWSSVWSQPSIADNPQSVEFYYVLEK